MYRSSLLYVLSFFCVTLAMDNRFSPTRIACPNIQEACCIDDKTLIVNTMNMCYTYNLLTHEKQILKKYKHYHELIKHPTQPLITLSDHQGITLYNYKTKEFRYFKTPNKENRINQCIFSPHSSTIYFYRSLTMFSINYENQPYKIINVTKQLQHTFRHNCSQSCDQENKLWRTFNIATACHPLKQNICLADGDNKVSIYNLEDSSKIISIHEEPCTSPPFFCEYALNASSLLLATQNINAFTKLAPMCNTIKILDIPHKDTITSDSIMGNNFVGMTIYKNGSVLATISSSEMVLQYWNLITKKPIDTPVSIYHRKKGFLSANNYFIHFCPNGKKIMVCKKEYDEIIILDVPFDIIAGHAFKKNTGSLTHLYSCILSKYGLIKEIKNYIIGSFLHLQRL